MGSVVNGGKVTALNDKIQYCGFPRRRENMHEHDRGD